MISDLILGVFAIAFYLLSYRLNKFWSYFFLFMGLSAIMGGFYHGYTEIGESFRFLSWSFLSVALLFALLGAYQGFGNKVLRMIFLLKSAVLLFLSIYFVNFGFMAVDTAISLLGFIVFGNIFFLHNQSRWIMMGIIVSLSSAFIFANHISYDEVYFTANDIGHYITIISLLLMFIGVRKTAEKEQLIPAMTSTD